MDIVKPSPGAGEGLIQEKAEGINDAKAEQISGKYPTFGKELPFTGLEAAGIVVAVGAGVMDVQEGDRMTALVSTGGFAEYAIAPTNMVIPLPTGTGFAEAMTLPIQGMTASTVPNPALPDAAGGILHHAGKGD